jgi:hypothetical protein
MYPVGGRTEGGATPNAEIKENGDENRKEK